MQAAQIFDGLIETENGHEEGEHIANRGAVGGDEGEVGEDEPDANGPDELNEGAGEFAGANGAHEEIDDRTSGAAELGHDHGFKVVGLNDPAGGEGLVHDVVDAGELLENVFVARPQFASIDDHRHEANREDHESSQAEHGLKFYQEKNEHDDGDGFADDYAE